MAITTNSSINVKAVRSAARNSCTFWIRFISNGVNPVRKLRCRFRTSVWLPAKRGPSPCLSDNLPLWRSCAPMVLYSWSLMTFALVLRSLSPDVLLCSSAGGLLCSYTYDHHILFVSENQKKCPPFCKAERFIKSPCFVEENDWTKQELKRQRICTFVVLFGFAWCVFLFASHGLGQLKQEFCHLSGQSEHIRLP